MTLLEFRKALSQGKKSFSDECFEDILFKEIQIERVSFYSCTFKNVTFKYCYIFFCKFIKCYFEKFNASSCCSSERPNTIQDCIGNYSTLITEPIHHQRVIRPAYELGDIEGSLPIVEKPKPKVYAGCSCLMCIENALSQGYTVHDD